MITLRLQYNLFVIKARVLNKSYVGKSTDIANLRSKTHIILIKS